MSLLIMSMSPYNMALLLVILTIMSCQIDMTMGFVSNRATSTSASTSFLMAKKSNNQAGKGFGKQPEIAEKSSDQSTSTLGSPTPPSRQQQQSSSSAAFTSVDGGSGAIPTISTSTTSKSGNVEDRTGSILREKYGLRTREEQEAEELKQKQVEEQKKKLREWKKLADEGEDFDLFQIIPDPILIFMDKFLKLGASVSTVLFVLAGFAISVEAGSKAFEHPLPLAVDNFISNVIEPNFTPGLGVLLSFSVGLGIFASLQLNSAASTYREDK
ncbi:MAG: hypothetical protein ACI8RD_005274 [Bacillariaceae sp.]|jgi:hypothetical protein